MNLRSARWIIAGGVAGLLIAVSAVLWLNAIVGSLFAYRSPLRAAPPAPQAPLGQPLTRRVVFVLIDALREDTSRRSDVMPFLNELRAQGAGAVMHSRPPSYSQTGYGVLLTGAWPDISDGPAFNLDYADIPTLTQDNLFSAVHRAGLKTAVSGYYWFEKLIPQADVSASFYTPGEDQVADRAVVDAALPWLQSGDYSLVLIHIDQVDYAGHHEGGPQGARWAAAARRADDLLREIAATLDLSQDTLFVCSDHGQIDPGGHGGTEPITLIEPFVLAGAGIQPGQGGDVNMVDVAPTLATLLGANPLASAQGQPRTNLLTLNADQAVRLASALEAQQAQLLTAYQTAMGRRVDPQPGADHVAANQQALEATRTARLNAERLWRAPLALIWGLAPLVVLFMRRSRAVAWGLGGALLYLAIFHMRYAWLDGNPYSFSALRTIPSFILYAAGNCLLALVVGWGVALLGAGGFRQGSRRAAEITLGVVFITLYGLSLPLAWSFGLNGFSATWTLPDFASTFSAMLALLQLLLVPLFGLALAGLAALIARKRTA